jgi:hypothetical protein
VRGLASIATLTLCVIVAGCGTEVVDDSAAPADGAYDGPLDVAITDPDDPEVSGRAGAALLALECSGEPSNGGRAGNGADPGRPQSSADRAVEEWFDEEGTWFGGLPQHGYVLERQDGDWALFSYDVGGATKAAVVVGQAGDDPRAGAGWGVYAWAACDPAEFPAEMTDELGLQVWEDADGHRVAQSVVSSHPGAEHCDWQDITFLTVGGDLGRSPQFVSDDGGEFDGQLLTSYDGQATLPADAVDTGFQRAGRHLWLAADESAAYLVALADATDVHRWPRASQPIGCD